MRRHFSFFATRINEKVCQIISSRLNWPPSLTVTLVSAPFLWHSRLTIPWKQRIVFCDVHVWKWHLQQVNEQRWNHLSATNIAEANHWVTFAFVVSVNFIRKSLKLWIFCIKMSTTTHPKSFFIWFFPIFFCSMMSGLMTLQRDTTCSD